MKVLIIDNFDSFTYNLVHYVEQFANEVVVVKNNEVSLDDIRGYSHIMISPGPGLPKDAGNILEVIKHFAPSIPIMGVCLGCQAIAEVYGGAIYNQKQVKHGLQRKVVKVKQNWPLFKSLANEFNVGLYHSWAVEAESLPSELEITARSKEGVIMAIQHKEYPLVGLQFHPESIMTDNGISIIENWLKLT